MFTVKWYRNPGVSPQSGRPPVILSRYRRSATASGGIPAFWPVTATASGKSR